MHTTFKRKNVGCFHFLQAKEMKPVGLPNSQLSVNLRGDTLLIVVHISSPSQVQHGTKHITFKVNLS